MKLLQLIICITCAITTNGQSTDSLKDRAFVSAAICFKKQAGFYWMNGATANLHFGDNYHHRAGINFTSSKLGSALSSNAISVHAMEFFYQRHFRQHKKLQPFIALNTGLAFASFGEKYAALPQRQLLLSPEFGFSKMIVRFPLLHLGASFGYNVFTGNGVAGLGLIYPVYFNLKLLLVVKKLK